MDLILQPMARVIFVKEKSDCVTSLLNDLFWLPNAYKITSKHFSTVHKVLKDPASSKLPAPSSATGPYKLSASSILNSRQLSSQILFSQAFLPLHVQLPFPYPSPLHLPGLYFFIPEDSAQASLQPQYFKKAYSQHSTSLHHC